MTETSRSRAPGEVALDERDVVVAERLVERRPALVGVVGERHPDRAAERAGLTISRGSPVPAANASSSPRTPARSAAQRGGADLAPVDDRQADARGQPLEERLVHAERRGGHARAGVRQAGRLEQRLDRAVLAERAVEGDEHDRRRVARRQPVERRAGRCGPVRAERGRVVVGGRRAVVRGDGRRQPPPAAVEVDQDLLDGVAGVARASAIAVPETIDTSCSADGPPRRTTIGPGSAGRSRRPSSRPASRPSRRGTRSRSELDAVALGRPRRARARAAARTSAAVPSGR